MQLCWHRSYNRNIDKKSFWISLDAYFCECQLKPESQHAVNISKNVPKSYLNHSDFNLKTNVKRTK